MTKEKIPTWNPEFIRDLSEKVYRARLEDDCKGNTDRMLAKDDDGGKKLTTSETAERLGYGTTAVRDMCESGQLDAYRRPGGHWRIPEQSVQRFEQAARPKVRRR